MKKGWLILTVILALICAAPALAGEATLFSEADAWYSDLEGFNGELYILGHNSLLKYDGATSSAVPVTDEINGNYMMDTYTQSLVSDANGLYALGSDSSRLIRVLNSEGQLDMTTVLSMDQPGYSDAAFIQDGVLYLVIYGEEGMMLYGQPMSGEAAYQAPIAEISAITGYKDGKAVAMIRERVADKFENSVVFIDLKTGAATTIAKPETAMYALDYDEATDTIYGAGNQRVYKIGTDGTLEATAYTLGGDVVCMAVFGDMAAVQVDSTIAVRDLKNWQNTTMLTMRRRYGRSEAYKTFLKDNPGIALVFTGDPSEAPEEQFKRDMATQDPNTDMYLMSDVNLLKSIYQKKYGVSYLEDAELRGLETDLYEPFAELLIKDGAMYALPSDLTMDMAAYTPAFFERFGFDVPTTMSELFELAKLWAYDYADDNPDASFRPFTSAGVTLESILTRYADACAGNGREVKYSTPEMTALITEFLEVKELYDNMTRSSDYPELYAFNRVYLPMSTMYEFMPLAIIDGDKPVIGAADMEMEYLVINPYSPNRDKAMALARGVCADWWDVMKVLLRKSEAKPVQNTYYEQNVSDAKSYVAEAEEALKDCEPIERQSLEDNLERALEVLKRCEDDRWRVSERDIGLYQSLVGRMKLDSFSPIKALIESQPDMINRLLGGSISVERFLQTLDEKLRAVRLEAE